MIHTKNVTKGDNSKQSNNQKNKILTTLMYLKQDKMGEFPENITK